MRGVVGSGEFRRIAGSEPLAGILLAASGLVTWVSLAVWGGLETDGAFYLREAWDLPAYLYVGLPVMALAVGIAAFLRPERPWRWPLWLVAGHQLGMLVTGVGMQSLPSLLLLTIILAVLLVVGFTIPAMLGAMAARAMEERAY